MRQETRRSFENRASRRVNGGQVSTKAGWIGADPFRGPVVSVFVFGILLLAAASFGQVPLPSGNLYGTTLDEDGKSVAGVTVTLRGPGAPLTASTDLNGDFRFLYLAPGTYSVALERNGFTPVRRDLIVSLGRNEVVTITMPVASAAEAVTVSGEGPAPDSRQTETGVNFDRRYLDTIPTTRDPWSILRQVPGVLVGDMNVNGGTTGAQSTFVGKGTYSDQNTYNLDGVAINLSYFDFDSLEDIEVATGGSDLSLATPGVSLNMVTRRGTNELRGSGRALYFFPSSVGSGDQVPSQGSWDYGLEAGGPLWKGRLWLWAAGARNDIPGPTVFLPEGRSVRYQTDLQFWNAKLNAQLFSANALTFSYSHFNKLQDGRDAGPQKSQESAWNQTTPFAGYRVEDSQVLSEKLFASIYFASLTGNFTLTPEGGDVQADYVGVDSGVWRNSYFFQATHTRQRQTGLTASGFFDTGDLRHELKFGFGYQHLQFDSQTAWPGGGLIGYEPFQLAAITRNSVPAFEKNYYDAYIGDTIQTGNLTINIGLRFDYQQGKNLPSGVSASPYFPELLPAVQYAGDASYPITRRLLQPRVGATYPLGSDRRTLLRASYSRFVNQLGNYGISLINPFPGPAKLFYGWNDANGNHSVEPDEITDFQFARNVNPDDPASTVSVNQVDPNFAAPITDEFIVGVERRVFADLSASIAYTHRSVRNLPFLPLAGTTNADYQYLGNAVGSATDSTGFTLNFNEPYYGLTTDPPPTGVVIMNRPDYHETYNGFELQIFKRLSHGWALRAGFAYNDWRQTVGPGAIFDPNNLWGGSNVSGPASEQPSDPTRFGNIIFINSKWQFNVSGMVQLPLGIELAANFFGRQGFLLPYYVNVFTYDTRDSTPPIQIGQVSTYRLPDVYQLDFSIQKLFLIGLRVAITPVLDCFNVLNSHTVLGRDTGVGNWYNGAEQPLEPNASFNAVSERLSDRTFRAGVRISF